MSERENAPFRVMCEMWGIETAIKKAKQLGIPVPQEAIEEQRAKDERMKNWWKDFLDSVNEQGES
jgi:hypothetical protein